MNKLLLLCGLTVAAGCATAPARHDHTVYTGHSLEEVRAAARAVVEEVAHPRSVVRLTDAGVVTEGRIGVCGEDVACGEGIGGRIGTPETTIEVELADRGPDTAVKVDIVYETRDHCQGPPDVACVPERLGSTGAMERRIITGIRDRLEKMRESRPSGST